ncbi:PREDICTED: G2/mitotic-specific cyclin-B1 [Nanorana parkeri]|uniref:G2/mitotic-specific cyclin-B1 n=1 Tax=Nanorana parkeri TaxID=125878 RepID=UPI00085473BA|nr:PREDICTED: G2/mitotic-specific cyclin-B1 [Nanorana parkeri]
MATVMTRSMRLNAEHKMETALATKKVGLLKPRQRNALEDIGNCLSRAKPALKKESKGVRTDVVEKVARPSPVEEEKPVPLSPMDTSGASPMEDQSEAFSKALLQMKDVDEDDADNPMLCSEYVKDIYCYLRELEAEHAVQLDYLKGEEITGNMRAILVDWLVQVHMRFKLLQETMFMTVSILDRFLQINPVPKKQLQLAGVTAMFIASKYEEIYCPTIGDFSFVTDHTYTKKQIRNMEMQILNVLKFNIGKPLPLHFLRRASKIGEVEAALHTLAKYLIELSMLDYEMVHFPPSQVAAAAFCLSQKVLDGGEWTPMLQHYMAYSESALIPVMQHLAKNVLKVNRGLTKFTSVRDKYARSQQMRISCLPQLNSEIMVTLAKNVC